MTATAQPPAPAVDRRACTTCGTPLVWVSVANGNTLVCPRISCPNYGDRASR